MRILPLLAAAPSLLFAAPALACSFAGQPDHPLDPEEEAVDVQAPDAPTLDGEVSVKRGVGPRTTGPGMWSATSCDDLGTISIPLAAGSDDRTALDVMGFRAEVVGGTLPDDMEPFDLTFRLTDGGALFLVWIDEDVDQQDAFDFDVEIRSVDLAGNESEESLLVTVAHDGAPAGCSQAAATPTALWGLLMLAPLARRRSA